MTFEQKKRHKHVINVTFWLKTWHFLQKKKQKINKKKGNPVKNYFFKTKKYKGKTRKSEHISDFHNSKLLANVHSRGIKGKREMTMVV